MKKFVLPIVAMAMILLLGSCRTSKQIPYFQNADSISFAASRGLYDARIMPKDLLTITVHTTNPEVSQPFNLTVSRSVSSSGQLSTGGGSLQGYLVDNNGDINFPVVGKVHVIGLTKTETEKPVVTVTMASYRVTVIGEVGSPRVIPVSTEKMSIIEALASAGDLSIYGKRENVMLIREDATGQKSVHRINLTDANLINSPYYYLQQNDVLYIEPNSVKAKNSGIGSSTTIWFSFIGIVTSVASLLVNVLRN